LAYTPLYPSGNFQKLSAHLHGQAIKKLSVEDFLLLPGYHRQVFLYKKTIAVFTQGKALSGGLYRNWAHTQLHLNRALMRVKPALKGLTLHLTWITFPSSSAPKEENYMEKVGYTHCTEDFLRNH
jgi:hypothetical protein